MGIWYNITDGVSSHKTIDVERTNFHPEPTGKLQDAIDALIEIATERGGKWQVGYLYHGKGQQAVDGIHKLALIADRRAVSQIAITDLELERGLMSGRGIARFLILKLDTYLESYGNP